MLRIMLQGNKDRPKNIPVKHTLLSVKPARQCGTTLPNKIAEVCLRFRQGSGR